MEKLPEVLSSKFESLSIEMDYKNRSLYSTYDKRNDDNYILMNF